MVLLLVGFTMNWNIIRPHLYHDSSVKIQYEGQLKGRQEGGLIMGGGRRSAPKSRDKIEILKVVHIF